MAATGTEIFAIPGLRVLEGKWVRELSGYRWWLVGGHFEAFGFLRWRDDTVKRRPCHFVARNHGLSEMRFPVRVLWTAYGWVL